MSNPLIGWLVALAALVLALIAAGLYFVADLAPPILLIGAALFVFGLVWDAKGPRPQYKEFASQGDILAGLGVIIAIVAMLVWLPSSLRIAAEPDFSTVAAIDAKIDRYLKTRQPEPSIFAAETFGGFTLGSADLDCKATTTYDDLQSILDKATAAKQHGQQPILVLIGMTDRTPLKPALKKRFESNVGLAAARADAVRSCLETVRPDASNLLAEMQTLRLTTGPAYSPEVSEPPRAEKAKLALDRQVSALLFSLPVTPAKAQHQPSSQPKPPSTGDAAQPLRHWLRLILLVLGVGGLLAVAVALVRQEQSQDSTKKTTGPPPPAPATPDCDKIVDAFAHVREMHQMFAQLRSTNFNFFIVIVGAEVTAAATLTKSENVLLPFIAALAVALTCVIFFGIEKRTVEMIGDARKELERLEEKLGVNLNRADSWETPAGSRRRKITHTNMYFATFMLVYLGALIALRLYYPGAAWS